MEENLNIKENEKNSNYDDFLNLMNASQCVGIGRNQEETTNFEEELTKFEDELQSIKAWLETPYFDGSCTKVASIYTINEESMIEMTQKSKQWWIHLKKFMAS